MRRDYCEKDGISVTYSEDNVCFEDVKTAEALVIGNDGQVLINNFNPERTAQLQERYRQIYHTIVYFRTLDRVEEAV